MIHTIRRQLARLAYPYGSVRTIRRGPLRGMQFRVGPGMGVSYVWGIEAMNWGWFQGQIRKGMTVYDVGANRGQMALLLAKLVGSTGRVVSFEPVTEVYADLVRNVELNSLRQVQTVNAAVADTDGEMSFTFDPRMPTQGKLLDCEPKYRIDVTPTSVQAVRLETVAANAGPPDLIKIDVEGGAGRVLGGAIELLRKHRPVLYIELHGPEEQAAIRDFVQGNGYTARTLAGEIIRDPTMNWTGVVWGDPGDS